MRITRILIICIVIGLAAIGLQGAAAQTASPAPSPTLPSHQIAEKDLTALVSQIHNTTVLLFSQAFEAELYDQQKLPWTDVRPQLIKHWSPYLVDGHLQKFYESHLWEWGYEMGFAFPMWKPEMIEGIKIISVTENEIVAEFKAFTNYETTEIIRVRLIQHKGNWVIDSQLNQQSV